MCSEHLNINFLQQFRSGMNVYGAASSPKKVENVLYRSFSGNKKEEIRIGKLLSGRLCHAKLICELMEWLNAGDRKVADQLFAKLSGLQTRFISYARSEPGTSAHYAKMLHLLRLLSKLVDIFRKEVIETLIISLDKINSGRNVNEQDSVITSGDVQDLQEVFVDYFSELEKYYYEFKRLLESESTIGDSVKVKTIVEQCLSDLMEEISMNIYQHERTEKLLNNWRLRLEFIEREEVYN